MTNYLSQLIKSYLFLLVSEAWSVSGANSEAAEKNPIHVVSETAPK